MLTVESVEIPRSVSNTEIITELIKCENHEFSDLVLVSSANIWYMGSPVMVALYWPIDFFHN